MQAGEARILVVDDEQCFRDAVSLAFERAGYQVLSAESGKAAFEILKRTSVDALVSDNRMPGWSGVQLLQQVREVAPACPVVLLLTGFDEVETEEVCRMGAAALFAKPFNRRSLLETVSRLLGGGDSLRRRPRPHTSTDLKVDLRFRGRERASDARVVNLGKEGMFVTSEQLLPNVGDEVSFGIMLGDGAAPLDGRGTVRWIRLREKCPSAAGFEIEFTSLPEIFHSRVATWLEAKGALES